MNRIETLTSLGIVKLAIASCYAKESMSSEETTKQAASFLHFTVSPNLPSLYNANEERVCALRLLEKRVFALFLLSCQASPPNVFSPTHLHLGERF